MSNIKVQEEINSIITALHKLQKSLTDMEADAYAQGYNVGLLFLNDQRLLDGIVEIDDDYYE